MVADKMEEWVNKGACDGFNIIPSIFPDEFESFVDLAVPELQRRGLYRRSYEGNTLRELLGLRVPESQYATPGI